MAEPEEFEEDLFADLWVRESDSTLLGGCCDPLLNLCWPLLFTDTMAMTIQPQLQPTHPWTQSLPNLKPIKNNRDLLAMDKSQIPHTFRLHSRQTHQINIKMASRERMTTRATVGEVITIHTWTANRSVQASRKMGKSRFLLLVGCVSLAQPIQGRLGRIASDEAGLGYRWNLKWFVVRNDQGVLGVMSNETWFESGLASGKDGQSTDVAEILQTSLERRVTKYAMESICEHWRGFGV
jgi:hypothetical protein